MKDLPDIVIFVGGRTPEIATRVAEEIEKLIQRGVLDDQDPETRFGLCAIPLEDLVPADGTDKDKDAKLAALHVYIYVRGLDTAHAQRVAAKIRIHTGPDRLKDPFFHQLKAGLAYGTLSREDAVREEARARKWNAS